MTLRVVSINIWGGRVYEPLMQYLPVVDADVYCLQEVYNAPVPMPEWLIYPKEDAWDGEKVRPNLYREISEVLPEHRGMYFPAARGFLHDGGKTEYPIEYGIATFVRKPIPIIGECMDFVYSEFRHWGYGDPPLSRNAHCVRLYDYEKDKPVTIAHMHGLWEKRGKLDTDIRETQAHAFASLISDVACDGDDVIACGDWNVLPTSCTFDILKKLWLRDLVVGGGHTDTRTSHYTKNPRYADYMMVSPGVRVTKFEIPAQPEVSDHRPLVLDCE
jgi:exonuclease III